VKIKILKCTNGAGSKHMKLKIYTTVIKPIVPYGFEMCTMTEQIKSSLKTWGWKVLRKTFGPIKYHNGWRI
jgi:hypothetical protein